jgi:hypothetical protein
MPNWSAQPARLARGGEVAAAVFVIVILALVFSGREGTRTALEDANPPATTGMAAPPTAAVPPGPPPATTGQGGQ